MKPLKKENRKFQFTFDQIADFVAEYTKDGEVKGATVWGWLNWFQERVNGKRITIKKKIWLKLE